MKNFSFMAIATGKQSTEAVDIKRYVGIAPVSVIGVNPNKEETKKLLGYEPQEEPVYFGTQEIDGEQIPYARICFVIKTDADKCGIDLTTTVNFFVRKQYRKGSNSGKYQVIDEYARDAWATKDVIEAKGKIMYKDGTMEANISQNYRPAYVGELALTRFIKAYLDIDDVQRYVNGTWVTIENPEMAECRFDDVNEWFKGNFATIKAAISLQPTNKVKALFGVRTTDEGKEYQEVYTDLFLKNRSRNYTAFEKSIEDRKANGGLNNRYYEICDLKEYVVTPTNISSPIIENNPWDAPATDSAW